MSSVVMLPSGRFRGFARHKGLKDAQVFDREDKAKAWAIATEKRMKAGMWEPSKKDSDEFNRTFKDAAEAYLASPAFLDKKDTTRHSEKHKLKPAIEAMGRIVLDRLTIIDIEEYLAARAKVQPKRVLQKIARVEAAKKRGDKDVKDLPEEVLKQTLSKDQRRLELAAISAVLNFSKEKKWIGDNPSWHVGRPGRTERSGRIDDERMGALMECFILLDDGSEEADLRPYWFFSLLFSCLARPGELAKARRDWLRHDPPQIVLPGTSTKNEDARAIVVPQPIYEGLMEMLDKMPPDCPYIFATRSRDRKSWKPYNYAVPWAKARERLGYEALVPHLARHEGISRMFERTNLSDGQIAGLSGHRTPQALWRYKHLRSELQRDKIENLHKDVMDAANRSASGLHPSRGLKPGERMGENRPVKKRAKRS